MNLPLRNNLLVCEAFLALFLGTVCELRAQQSAIPVVHIDPHTRVAQNAAPFDHSFFLVLPVDTTLEMDELNGLEIMKVNPKKRKGSFERHTTVRYYNDTDLQRAWFVDDTPKVAGVKYLKFFVDRQLLPNTPFAVILYVKPSHVYLEKFNQMNQELYENDVETAKADYETMRSGLKARYSDIPIIWTLSFEKYRQIFEQSIRPLYEQINAMDEAIYKSLKALSDTLRSSNFKMTDLFECNCQEDFVARELFADSTEFLIPLQNLLNVQNIHPYFAAGRANIQEFEPYKRANLNEIQKRIGNYQRLKKVLVNISYFCHLSSFSDRFSIGVRKGVYNAVYDALPAIDSRIKILSGVYTKVREKLNALPQIGTADLSYGDVSPKGEDLQTSSGHYIIADFGLANALSFVNNRTGYLIRPYLGVNFSFVALDKSQPLNAIQNKRFLHHLSMVVGLTTSALSRQGTSDLINNLSVVGGVAYRCTRAFRVTFGGLLYKRDNPNPLLPQRVTVGPMLALSLDLDLAHWFSELKGKLF